MQGEKLKLVAVGDLQISTKHSNCKEEAFLEAIKLIREADVSYANLEHLIHNYGADCYPVYNRGGTFSRAPPSIVEEMKWMGFSVVSCATNHAFDYMVGGIKETNLNLDAGNLPHAGIGMNLAEAIAPTFIDSSQGRVGLISVAIGSDTTWIATDARKDMQGKPGINLIRAIKIYKLDTETFQSLKATLNKMQSLGIIRQSIPNEAEEFDITIGKNLDGIINTKFILGDKMEVNSIGYEKDIANNLEIIDDAKRQADWVFVACHHHLTDGLDGHIPSKVVQSFAHQCLDTGADGFLGSGPHQMQGIEIYKNKPIFYSLPDFIQQRDLMPKSPQIFYETFGLGFENTPMDPMDERAKTIFTRLYQNTDYAESGIAISTFEKNEVKEIKLYPVDLGFQKPRWQFGRPRLAHGELAERIIKRWASLSEPFGTKIDAENNIGIVKMSLNSGIWEYELPNVFF
jgi:poly-gamma-glutamate synthesis protein (capsule biosynthesis protein)